MATNGPNRTQRRRPTQIPRQAEPELQPLAMPPAKRFWHIGPKIDRILHFVNLTPNGCGLLLGVVATLGILAFAAAAWLR